MRQILCHLLRIHILLKLDSIFELLLAKMDMSDKLWHIFDILLLCEATLLSVSEPFDSQAGSCSRFTLSRASFPAFKGGASRGRTGEDDSKQM
jgi:hypothetical protein